MAQRRTAGPLVKTGRRIKEGESPSFEPGSVPRRPEKAGKSTMEKANPRGFKTRAGDNGGGAETTLKKLETGVGKQKCRKPDAGATSLLENKPQP